MARQKKKTTKKQKPSDPFSKLTWEDLEEWAGNVIVGRGRPYQRKGAVENLGRTEGGTLAAWVRGTRRYATRVRLTEKNGLESACTCPYWDTCKHAVAVVLEYLECLKTDSAIGEIEEDDPRLLKLEAIVDEDEEFAEEEEKENARSGRSKSKKSKAASLRPYLEEQTKAELVALVIELADAHDAARCWSETQERSEDRLASAVPRSRGAQYRDNRGTDDRDTNPVGYCREEAG